ASYLDVAAALLGELGEVDEARQLLHARLARDGPEVHHHDLAALVAQPPRLAVPVQEREGGREQLVAVVVLRGLLAAREALERLVAQDRAQRRFVAPHLAFGHGAGVQETERRAEADPHEARDPLAAAARLGR